MNDYEEQANHDAKSTGPLVASAAKLHQPAILILVFTAAGYLSSWVYLDGYLGFFGAQRHWFDLSLPQLIAHAWPAQAFTLLFAAVLLWAANRMMRGAGSLATASLTMFFTFLTWSTIEGWTYLMLDPDAEYAGPAYIVLIFAAILGLGPLLKPTFEKIGLFTSPRWSERLRKAARITAAVWVTGLFALLYLVPLKLGAMNAASQHARIQAQLQAFGRDQAMPLVFSDGTSGLWIETPRAGPGDPLRMFITGPMALGEEAKPYTTR